MRDYHPVLDVIPWIPSRHCEEALLRRPVKPTVSPRGVTTVSKKIKKIEPRGQATG